MLVELNSEQMKSLLRMHQVNIGDMSIEMVEDTLMLNNAGVLSELKSMNLQFSKNELANSDFIDYFRNLVCEHLNLSPNEVIYHHYTVDEIGFRIRIFTQKELFLIMSDRTNVVLNCQKLYEGNDFITEYQIGPYRRLCNSQYYFRWVEYF